MIIDPKKDGIDHINVYSKGKTELGRFLSNFTAHMILTEDGYFKSVEGYWYWLLTPEKEIRRSELRYLVGFQAKNLGRLIAKKDWPEETNLNFKEKIKTAILLKINSDAFVLFKINKLPFVHYYNYGGKIIEPEEGKWIVDFLNELRENNG